MMQPFTRGRIQSALLEIGGLEASDLLYWL